MTPIALAGFSTAEIRDLLLFSQTTLHIVLILALAWIALRLSSKGIRFLRDHLRERAGEDIEEMKRIATLSRVFRYAASVVITVVAGMLVLSEIGISIAPILATAGVLGIAIGFGAQSLIKDYFNGFFILLENQIRQGDVVQAAGMGGFVEEVTLRYIKMRDYDGNVHFIPNGIITTVTNMSRDYAFSVIDIGVAYRENTDEVMAVMAEVGKTLREDPDFQHKILEDMEMAGVDRLDDSAVVIRCRFKVQPLEQWTIRREYHRRIKLAFDRLGIEIPYPHLTLYPGQNKDGSAPPLHLLQSTLTK